MDPLIASNRANRNSVIQLQLSLVSCKIALGVRETHSFIRFDLKYEHNAVILGSRVL